MWVVSDETKPYLTELILALHVGMASYLSGNKAENKGGVEEEAVANWSKHDFPLITFHSRLVDDPTSTIESP